MLALDIECIAWLRDDERLTQLAARREQDVNTFAALFPALARVICVAMRNTDTGGAQIVTGFGGSTVQFPPELHAMHDCRETETELLDAVATVLSKSKQMLTFNGRGYDLPTLAHRMTINGITVPSIILNALHAKPWEQDKFHIDMSNVLNFGGAFGRYALEAYAIAYNLPNPKQLGSGNEVYEMFINNRIDQLTTYCLADVDVTIELWRRWTGQ